MLSNLIQKPTGAVAVLLAAVGGPYAAFETEVGAQIRRAVWNTATQSSSGAVSGSNTSPDPNSLGALSGYSGYSNERIPNLPSNSCVSGTTGYGNYYPSSSAINASAGMTPAQASGALQTGMVQSIANYPANSSQQLIAQQMGPVTVTPMNAGYGQMGSFNYPAGNSVPGGGYYPNNSAGIEGHQGEAALVPGATTQLWDYTVGSPSLQQLQNQNVSVTGGAVTDLREVLRFDITPGWLPQRFARVTTVLSNVQLDGLRVPLVTGTRPTDLAGTLTYYFDSSQSLRRINLQGLMGDPSQLAQLMVQFYGLKPEQMLGGQLFTTRWNNRVAQVLHVAPAPILYAGADHSRYVVFLELNQPGSSYGLSQEASELLQKSQMTNRW